MPLTQQQVQAEVDARLPFQKAEGPFHYGVSAATVDLLPDGRVEITAVVDGAVGGRHAGGDVTATSALRYHDGGFYLSRPRIERDDVALEPEHLDGPEAAENDALRFRDKLAAIGRAVDGGAVAQAAKSEAATLAEDAVDGLVAVRPIYVIKPTDTKRSLARLVLRDVRVENGHLVLVLDPFGALVRTILTAAAVALAALFLATALLAFLDGTALLGMAG